MKKLLFSLGTVAAIVAPVAAVVACGKSSSNAKPSSTNSAANNENSATTFKSSEALNTYITKNWNTLGAKADVVFNKLKGQSGDLVVSDLTTDKAKKDSTFKAVFIKGTPSDMPKDATWDHKTGDETFYKWGGTTYQDVDMDHKESSAERWNMEESKLANFSYIAFLTEFNGKHSVYINKVIKNDKGEYGTALSPANRIDID